MLLRQMELLRKFSGSEELVELINLVIIQDQEARENQYMAEGSYPEPRNLLGLLKIQLMTTEKHLEEEENERNR